MMTVLPCKVAHGSAKKKKVAHGSRHLSDYVEMIIYKLIVVDTVRSDRWP